MKPLIVAAAICWSTSLLAQTADFVADTVCHGNLTAFTGNAGVPDSLISNWLWDMDNDGQFDDATGKVVNFSLAQADTSLVGLKIIPVSGPADSIVKPVVVWPVPDVNFHVDNSCAFQAAWYISQTTISSTDSIWQWQWDFDNNDTIDDNTGPVVPYTCGPAQTYVSKLTCVSYKGCTSFATKTTEIFNQPAADFTYTSGCLGSNTDFFNNSSLTGDTISYYLWDFGDNEWETTFGNPAHTYASAGTYNARLIAVTVNNCKDTAYMNVSVNPPPAITLQYDNDTVILTGQEVTITVNGNASSYLWSPNGETTNSITVSESGIFSVTATDANSCTETLSTEIVVKDDKINVGGIVTPNGDGINDNLTIEDLGVFYDNCEITIYNRWNDVVYSNLDYQNDWEGTYNGKQLDAGTYFYIIKCSGPEVDDKTEIGSINILK